MDPYSLHPPATAEQLRQRDEKIVRLGEFLDQKGGPTWIRLKRLFRIGRRRQPSR